MQKVIFLIAALLILISTNSTKAQSVESTTPKVSKQDTLIVTNPNTIIVYQGANVPVVYAQPNAKDLAPMYVKKNNQRGGKILLAALAGGLAGLVVGGSIASNNVEPNLSGILFSPLTIMAGAFTGCLVGTGTGVGLGLIFTK